MAVSDREVTRDDILPMARYAAEREERRAGLRRTKKRRRLEVGPSVTFYFENYETMWMQIHEMLYVEKGGEAQIADELSAYNPLIPKGRELVATMMFEIDDPVRRGRLLSHLGGVERTVTLTFSGETVRAVPEEDVERSKPGGRASSVHFLHFPFAEAQVAKFREPEAHVVLGIGHESYAHMTVLPETTRLALGEDFA